MAFRTIEISNSANIHIKRRAIARSLAGGGLSSRVWNTCMIGKKKLTILSAIEVMCESLKNCYLKNDTTLLELPTVIKIEKMGLINE